MTSLQPHRYTLVVSARQGDDSLRTRDKSRLVTKDIGIAVTISRPDITEGLPEREMTRLYVPQMTSVETLPVLKEEFAELPLGRSPLTTWCSLTRLPMSSSWGWMHCATTMRPWI
jgi:hypothetical protein